jgi:hypothetical protein
MHLYEIITRNNINLKNNNNDNSKDAYAGQLNSLTQTRDLLVLHDRSMLAYTTIATLGIIPPTKVIQIEKETLKGGLLC